MKVYFLCEATLVKKPEHSNGKWETVTYTKVFVRTLGSSLQHTDIRCES